VLRRVGGGWFIENRARLQQFGDLTDFLIQRSKPFPEFLESVPVATRSGVHWNLQRLGDGFKRETFPELEMHHRPLLRRQNTQRGSQLVSVLVGVRVLYRGKQFDGFLNRSLLNPISGLATPDQVNAKVVRPMKQVLTLISHRLELFRSLSQRDEQFLEQIQCIRLIPGQIEQEREQCRRMAVAKLFELERCHR